MSAGIGLRRDQGGGRLPDRLTETVRAVVRAQQPHEVGVEDAQENVVVASTFRTRAVTGGPETGPRRRSYERAGEAFEAVLGRRMAGKAVLDVD